MLAWKAGVAHPAQLLAVRDRKDAAAVADQAGNLHRAGYDGDARAAAPRASARGRRDAAPRGAHKSSGARALVSVPAAVVAIAAEAPAGRPSNPNAGVPRRLQRVRKKRSQRRWRRVSPRTTYIAAAPRPSTMRRSAWGGLSRMTQFESQFRAPAWPAARSWRTVRRCPLD